MIKVQHEDFDPGDEIASLHQHAHIGAVVSFVGTVRDVNDDEKLSAMLLEHYPAMTQKSLEHIAESAKSRWDIVGLRIIHRVGYLQAADRIVFVGVASRHRRDAFNACEFIVDMLKTRAPFWKKEFLASGEQWVEAKEDDEEAACRWGLS